MKTLKTATLIISLLFLFGLNINAKSVEGNGTFSKELHVTKKFSKINIGGAFEVKIVQGDKYRLIVEADENIQKYIISSVVSGTLSVKLKESKVKRTNKLRLLIVMPKLKDITAFGAAKITATGFDCNTLTITTADGAKVNIDANTKTLIGNISGVSTVNLKGKNDKLIINANGNSKINAEELECKDGEITVCGATEISVNINDTLTTNIKEAAKFNNISETVSTSLSLNSEYKSENQII